MKTKIYFLSLLLLASIGLNAQTWTLMDSVNSSNSVGTNYYDFSPDGQHGIISAGWVYNSTSDAGVTWSADINNNIGVMRVVNFIDNSIVFSSQDGHLYKSTNAGSSWSEVTVNMNGYIRDVKINGSNGIAVSSDGEVAYSTDSGSSWTKLANNPFGNLSAINMIEMLTPSLAYISGQNNLFMKTTDGGQTWTSATGAITGQTFYSPTSGYYSDGTHVFKSFDAGANWTIVNATGTIPTDVFCYNATTFYGIRDNKIYKSVDGGFTWTLDYTLPYLKNIGSIKFSGNTGYAIVANVGSGSRWMRVNGLQASSISESGSSPNVALYPNPNNGVFEISLDEKLNEQVITRIVDIAGKEVYSKKVSVSGNILPVSVNGLKAGTYFLEIQTKDKTIAKHFVLN